MKPFEFCSGSRSIMQLRYPMQSKTIRSNFGPAASITLFWLACSASTVAIAQEQVRFLDDFSADSIRYIIDDRPDDRSDRSYVVGAEGIRMTVSAVSDENQGSARIYLSDPTDTVRARFSLSSDTVLPMERDAEARMRIQGIWYNEMQDGGLGNGSRVGDVFGQARLRLRGDGDREFSFCLDRELEGGGFEGVDIFAGDNCIDLPNFVPELDTVYEAQVTLDREANTIAFGVGDNQIVTPIGQTAFQPAFNNKQVNATHEGLSGQAVGTVSGIGTDGELQNFLEEPLVSGPYRPIFDLESGDRSLVVTGGRARFEVGAPEDSNERLSLTIFGTSDTVVASLELSSETVIPANDDPEAEPTQMRIGGTFYNDTAEGGFNEAEGNVFAAVLLRRFPDSSMTLEYCLFRSDTVDFSSGTELVMEGGTECGSFGLTPELDTAYPVSIAIDREAGTILFTANGIERTHTITTPVFALDPTQFFLSAQGRAGAGARLVGYLDDFGTSADAPLVADVSTEAPASSSGGSSGGCSIVGSRTVADPTLGLLGLAALFCLVRRRLIPQRARR